MGGQRSRAHPLRVDHVVGVGELGVPGQLGRVGAAGELGQPLVLRAGQLGQLGQVARPEGVVPEHLAEQVALLGTEVLGRRDGTDRAGRRGELGIAQLGRQRVGDGDQAAGHVGVPVAGQLTGLQCADRVADPAQLGHFRLGRVEHRVQRGRLVTGRGRGATETACRQVGLRLRRGHQRQPGGTAAGAQRVGLGDLLLQPVGQPDGRGRGARHDLGAAAVERGAHRELRLHHAEHDQSRGGHDDRQQQT